MESGCVKRSVKGRTGGRGKDFRRGEAESFNSVLLESNLCQGRSLKGADDKHVVFALFSPRFLVFVSPV